MARDVTAERLLFIKFGRADDVKDATGTAFRGRAFKEAFKKASRSERERFFKLQRRFRSVRDSSIGLALRTIRPRTRTKTEQARISEQDFIRQSQEQELFTPERPEVLARLRGEQQPGLFTPERPEVLARLKRTPTRPEFEREVTEDILQSELRSKAETLSGLGGDELTGLAMRPEETGVVGMSTEQGPEFSLTATEEEISGARELARERFKSLPKSKREKIERENIKVAGFQGLGQGIDFLREFTAGQSLKSPEELPSLAESLPFFGERIKESRGRDLPLKDQLGAAALGGIVSLPFANPIRTALPASQIGGRILSSQLDDLAVTEFRTSALTFADKPGMIKGVEIGARAGGLGGKEVFVSGGIAKGQRGLTATKVRTEIEPFGLFKDTPLTKGFKKTTEMFEPSTIIKTKAPTGFKDVSTGEFGLGLKTGKNVVGLAPEGGKGAIISGKIGESIVRIDDIAKGPGGKISKSVVGDLGTGKITSRGQEIFLDLSRKAKGDKAFTVLKGTGAKSPFNIQELGFPPTATKIRPQKVTLTTKQPGLMPLTGPGALSALKTQPSAFTGTGLYERTSLVKLGGVISPPKPDFLNIGVTRPGTTGLQLDFPKPKQDILPGLKPGITNLLTPGIKQKPGQIPRPVSGIKSGLGLSQAQSTKMGRELAFSFPGGDFFRGGGFGFPGLPKLGRGFGFALPPFQIGAPEGRKRRAKPGKRKFKRQPSLGAVLLDIRSKKPRKGEVTGLVERPILGGI